MEFFLILVSLVAAAAGGFYFGRNSSGNTRELGRLEAELKEKQEQLDAFRNKVTSHFEKTADLFNHVSDSYQSLYDHMAKSSSQLCATQTFQSLPTQQATNSLSQAQVPETTSSTTPSPAPASAPVEESQNSQAMFDANNLYNAHDYRNQQQEEIDEENQEKESKAAKVVDIESAKEERNEPALDYAIKEKGVINHNSLDVEGIKTS